MLSLAELSQAIDAYRSGSVSLSQFEDWFQAASRSMFGEPKEVLDACVAVEMAFSELRDGGMSRADFDKELAAAIAPFSPKAAKPEQVRVFFSLNTGREKPSSQMVIRFAGRDVSWGVNRAVIQTGTNSSSPAQIRQAEHEVGTPSDATPLVREYALQA